MNTVTMELQQLVSPEKALHLLCNMVDANPSLWRDLHLVLNSDDDDCIMNNNDDQTITHCVSSVLHNLRSLQLSELPVDTISVITSFLPWRCCLHWGATNSFFNRLIPKYIHEIFLNVKISRPVYKLLYKVQHLRFLSIDGSVHLDGAHENMPFLIPFGTFKSVQSLNFKNVRFLSALQESYRFDGGRYSARSLLLNSCHIEDRRTWVQMTSNSHSPDLETVRIVDHIPANGAAVESLSEFALDLVSSRDHHQIRNLALTLYDDAILSTMRRNPFFARNLKKLEIALIHRDCLQQNGQNDHDDIGENNTANLFRTLFMSPASEDSNHAIFRNLEMLLIDFCPNTHCGRFTDIAPSDLSAFSASIPTVFPALKLLALYGSGRELPFTDEHLRGFLDVDGHLEGIIDLSLGFEHLSAASFDHLVGDILNTFPNVAWLTLEHRHFLTASNRFHETLAESVDPQNHNLKWITLCSAERDEIHTLSNGVYVEYWDRGIAQCQFDAALVRSTQIVHEKNSGIMMNVEEHQKDKGMDTEMEMG